MGHVGKIACGAAMAAMRARQIRFSIFVAVIAAAAATAGQAEALMASSLSISQARHLIARATNIHGFTWNRRIDHCRRRVAGSPPKTVVRCRLSEYGRKVSNGHLFVGPVVQQWKAINAGGFTHLELESQRESPLPLQFSVKIDPNVQQSSGHDQNGNWWSADYTFSTGATAGTMNLVAIRELPNGVVTFSAPAGSYVGGETSCSYRVGSGVSTQSCAIEYRHPGTYQVTAWYTPDGASSVSVTESVNIG